ncbi:hypothetical protein DPSP01_003679 [Paraphaeosphaeria sporulosa]|uniref:Uncharacterized protein n=1 Tax=Paraphaeosphaeria sporulosa TaxID=1460663 RepID=A0A177CQS5_9PLEO|nr:uncharacterized protein CC84DRAFT_1213243 [Paraphaeosphaeria sporulosa]OAG09864.1 hypothetical protein CC84DRAFT_1213243 [Paraphaeosphaeria sporulosa]
MPPKKKATGQQPSPKKQPVKQNDDAAEEVAAPPPDGEYNPEPPEIVAELNQALDKKHVRWTRPVTNWFPWRKSSEWATILFQRPWEELAKEKQHSFDRPHLPSLLYQEETGNNKSYSNDPQGLRTLYRNIQDRREHYLDGIKREEASMIGMANEGPDSPGRGKLGCEA